MRPLAMTPSLIAREATTTDRVDGVLESLRGELATLALQLRMATAHAEATVVILTAWNG